MDMLQGHRRRLHVPRPGAAELDPGGFLEVPRHGRRLDDELEGVVLERRYRDAHGRLRLVLLGAGVEVLAEGHEVDLVLPQRGAQWRSCAGPACGDGQADCRAHRPPG
ncbi:hypothetical protein Tsubulata_022512 [Turnera subulata]|uniref:Uncharacterized protein n=1 Tax=Turnera subulata TaxID=218843 RepID=A0A9Q0FWL2_9ROSI|nr:hypothetical protein Tsubulata_022512 [Turnera subulata]